MWGSHDGHVAVVQELVKHEHGAHGSGRRRCRLPGCGSATGSGLLIGVDLLKDPAELEAAYDDALEWLVFVSHRTGRPQVFVEERATGRLVQLTDRDDVNGTYRLDPREDPTRRAARPAEDPEAQGEATIRARRPAREVTRQTLEFQEILRMPGTGGDALACVGLCRGGREPGALGEFECADLGLAGGLAGCEFDRVFLEDVFLDDLATHDLA
jgi:hypothetical protein